jgi:hypothetical protein
VIVISVAFILAFLIILICCNYLIILGKIEDDKYETKKDLIFDIFIPFRPLFSKFKEYFEELK